MLPVCDSIFDKYALSDDFEGNPYYDIMITEILGTITDYI